MIKPIEIETMTLDDLKQMQLILREKLSQKERWMESQRVDNYEDIYATKFQEFLKRQFIYHSDENHEKLRRVSNRIQHFINADITIYQDITFKDMSTKLTLNDQLTTAQLIRKINKLPTKLNDGLDIATYLTIKKICLPSQIKAYQDFVNLYYFNFQHEPPMDEYWKNNYIRIYIPKIFKHHPNPIIRIIIPDDKDDNLHKQYNDIGSEFSSNMANITYNLSAIGFNKLDMRIATYLIIFERELKLYNIK